jgi:hypothetical protein
MRRLLAIALAFAAATAPAFAQTPDVRVLPFDSVESVTEPEPAIVKIVFVDPEGKKTTIRMNIFAAQNLAAKIEHIGQ